MQDYAIRATAAAGRMRAVAVRSTGLVDEARRRHDTYPVVTAALGRLLTATAMLTLDLQEGNSVTVRVNGGGPLGSITTVGQPGGQVRGYVQEPHVQLPSRPGHKLDVGGGVGREGLFQVSMDLGLHEPYTGSVPLVNGEIAEDFTRYLVESQQVPSAVALGVLVETDNSARAAGGYLLQLLPGAEDQMAVQLEERVQASPPVSSLLDGGDSPEDILRRLLSGWEPVFYGRQELSFSCTCSRPAWKECSSAWGRRKSVSWRRIRAGLTCAVNFAASVTILTGMNFPAWRARQRAGRRNLIDRKGALQGRAAGARIIKKVGKRRTKNGREGASTGACIW